MSADTALEVGRLYVPIKMIADVLTASQGDIFVRLPGLEGYWPGGIRTSAGSLIDHSSAGGSLDQTGTPQTDFDGNSYVHLGNGVNYFSRAAYGAILGTETYINPSLRGLTVGGWAMVDVAPTGNNYGIVSKWGVGNDRSYGLRYLTSSVADFTVSGTGIGVESVSSGPVAGGEWHFIVGRFTPSTEIAIIVDGDKTVNTTSIPAALFNASQAFEMGRLAGVDVTIFEGKVRDMFLCAAALSDELIEDVRRSSAP